MKEILFVVLSPYADWEAAALAAEINEEEDFCVKTVSISKEPIKSIGGFSVNPDYSLSEALSREFAGLILIGGNSRRTEEAKQVAALVTLAVERSTVVAAICDATVFLGAMGILNGIEHTSNRLESLQKFAGEAYSGESSYINQQSVRCGNIITANGTANLEFTRDVLIALGIMSAEEAEEWYRFYKLGLHDAAKAGHPWC